MTIIVKSISEKYGKDESTDYDDFKEVIKNPKFGGSIGMKDISIRSVRIQSGVIAIKALQFTYEVTTIDGVSYPYVGMMYGSDGGTVSTLSLVDNERITNITGKYGGEVNATHIRYLQFQTPERIEEYGVVNETDTEFTLPVGVFFGSGDPSTSGYVDSLGTYEIVPAIEPTVTLTPQHPVTVLTTVATATTALNMVTASPKTIQCNSTPQFVALSVFTSIFGLIALVASGMSILLYKNRPKG
jgi:hypothetical protein